jgi:hypothetical protein
VEVKTEEATLSGTSTRRVELNAGDLTSPGLATGELNNCAPLPKEFNSCVPLPKELNSCVPLPESATGKVNICAPLPEIESTVRIAVPFSTLESIFLK